MNINVKSDIKKLTRELNDIQRKVIPKAVRRSLNNTLRTVSAHAARSISQKTGIKVGTVKKHLLKTKAQANRLQAEIIAQRYAPNLIEFMTAAQIKRAMQRKGQGVRAKAWRQSKEYRGAFVGRGRNSGKQLVYARTGPGNKAKLKALAGPSVRRTFIEKEINRSIRMLARDQFKKNFEADLQFYLSKL